MTNMYEEIQMLLEDIKADYARWTENCAKGDLSAINVRMIREFNEGLSFSEGKKYVKVLTKGSVWGFIVAVDNDKKFHKGDILKAAGYNVPARNKARGNILKGGYNINWTGPNYLR